MSRNNQDRMGGPIPQSEEPPQNNPLLNFVKPTQFIELPSKGRGYPDNHPLKDKEVIEIFHMTAKDEDILTSETLIKQGVVLDRFVENILVDKSIKLNSILIGDKNAILIESRILGYGLDYNAEMICPNCFTSCKIQYDLNNRTLHYGSDDEPNQNGFYSLKLPESGVELEVKLLTSEDEAKMIKRNTETKKKKSTNSLVTDQYKLMIASANGITDRTQINEFAEMMPLKDSLVLKKFYRAITPNVELKFDFICKSCGYEQELEVPLGAEFFWPKQ